MMNKEIYILIGSDECGEEVNLAVFTDKEKAETELSNLEGKIVMGYDEFRIDSWVENEKCYDEDSITNLTDL